MPVADRVFVPAHLGALTDQLPAELIDEVLVQTLRQQRRVRLLPARLMVLFVLAMTLFPDRGYGRIWAALCASVRQLLRGIPSTAALRQARNRLGATPLRELFDRLRGPVAPAVMPGAWWRGLRVVAWDGSTLALAEQTQIRSAFGGPTTQHAAGGRPQMRIALLVECGTRAIIDAVFGSYRSGEPELAARMLPSLRGGMLLLADRNFVGLDLWRQAAATGAHLLWRMPSYLTWRPLRRLSDGSWLATRPGQRARRGHPATTDTLVRVIEATITIQRADGTCRTEPYVIMTTLLDSQRHPARDLIELYHQRWEIEICLLGLKAIHKGTTRTLRSKTVEGVHQEFYALMITHHLLRQLICHAALDTALDPDQISFTTTLHAIQASILNHRGVRDDNAIPDWQDLLAELTDSTTTAVRRSRVSPRPSPRTRTRPDFVHSQKVTYTITIDTTLTDDQAA
ncbi:IS4 family transposase [Nonomuraea sp. NPDC059194]|uniref:IS4 family transposase n=1 Tax=Nonomuraea sp. NPDC059194 TaxID=3346764 RepID=UPI00367B23D1